MAISRSKFLLWSVLLALSGCAVVAILMIVSEFRDLGGRTLATLLSIGAYSLAALACNWVLDRGIWRIAMVAGLVSCGLGLAVILVWIWVDPNLPSRYSRVVGGTAVFPAMTSAVMGLLALTRFNEPLLRRTRLLGLWIVGSFATSFYLHFLLDTGVHGKVTGVLAVLSGLVLVGLPIAQRLYGVSMESTEIESARPEVFLRCPRCDHEQTLRTGRAECAQCHLRIEIKLEEPRCPGCNYLLYKLASSQCPECGRAVAAT